MPPPAGAPRAPNEAHARTVGGVPIPGARSTPAGWGAADACRLRWQTSSGVEAEAEASLRANARVYPSPGDPRRLAALYEAFVQRTRLGNRSTGPNIHHRKSIGSLFPGTRDESSEYVRFLASSPLRSITPQKPSEQASSDVRPPAPLSGSPRQPLVTARVCRTQTAPPPAIGMMNALQLIRIEFLETELAR